MDHGKPFLGQRCRCVVPAGWRTGRANLPQRPGSTRDSSPPARPARRPGRQRQGRRRVRRHRPRARPGGHVAGRPGGSRGRRRRAADAPTAASWPPPTSSSRAGTSGATGRRRRTSGTRRPRPTSPTSPRWAARRRRCWWASPARRPPRRAGWRASRPGSPRSARPSGPPSSAATSWRRRPTAPSVVLSVTALGRPRRPGAGAALGRAARRRGGASPGRLGWAACGLAVLRRGFSSPLAVVVGAPPAHPAVRGRAGRRRRRGHVDVRRQRRAARRPRARRRGQPGGRRPGPGGAGAHLPGTGRARCSRSRSALGADPLAWVLTGGEDHALVATFPAGRPAARGMDGDRRGAGPAAGRRGCSWTACRRRTSSAAIGAEGAGMSTSAEPCATARRSRCGRCPTTTRWRSHLVGRVQQEYVDRYGGRDAARRRPGGVPAAARGCSSSPRWPACRPAAARGGRYPPGGARSSGSTSSRRSGGAALAQLIVAALERSAAAAGHRRSSSTPATGSPRRWRSTRDLGYTPVPATGSTPARPDAVFLGKDLRSDTASGEGRRSGHGRRDGLGGLRRGGSGDRARRRRAARACPSTTGRSRPRSPGGWACRSAEAEANDETVVRGLWRLVASLGTMPDPVGGVLPDVDAARRAGLPAADRAGARGDRRRRRGSGARPGRGDGAQGPAGRAARPAGRPAGPAARGGVAAGRAGRSRRSAARWRPTTAPARPTCGTSTGATPPRRRHYHLVVDSTALPIDDGRRPGGDRGPRPRHRRAERAADRREAELTLRGSRDGWNEPRTRRPRGR